MKKLRCAIYTRKSSEEGLDQSFNSLHAQREACEAYVASQKPEGWVAIRDHYDDRGFSGGTRSERLPFAEVARAVAPVLAALAEERALPPVGQAHPHLLL